MFSPKTKEIEPAAAAAKEIDPLVGDTVGYHTVYSGATPLQVRGFGVVSGLGTTGSTECPSAIREYLLEFMRREYQPGAGTLTRQRFSPQKLLDSPDCAVVDVTAVIPAGAPRGTFIDLQVSSLPGSGTQSLEGGLLLPCELRLFDVNASGTGLLQGRVVARGGGPVFVNPYTHPGEEGGVRNPRRGFVLGGGRTIEDRTAQLQMVEPSYPLARRIERRLNERFGPAPLVAEAMSQAYVLIHTPKSYIERPIEFLSVLPYCSMHEEEGFRERKLRELIELVRRKPELLERVALAWEALGRVAIPTLRTLQADGSRLAYYAARSAARLGDAQSVGVLGEFARGADLSFAVPAVQEIGNRRLAYGAEQIVTLLNSRESTMRIAAYEALAKMGHPAIRRRVFPCAMDRGQAGVILDEVQTQGAPMIYFKRTRQPRLAVFGRIDVRTPVMLSLDEDRVTVTSDAGAKSLAVFARGRATGRLSQRITCGADVASLVQVLADPPLRDEEKKVRGLGLTYAEVLRVILELEQGRSIAADIVGESVDLNELLGPLPLPERAPTDAGTDDQAPRTNAGAGGRPVGESSESTVAPGASSKPAPARARTRRSDSLWDD